MSNDKPADGSLEEALAQATGAPLPPAPSATPRTLDEALEQALGKPLPAANAPATADTPSPPARQPAGADAAAPPEVPAHETPAHEHPAREAPATDASQPLPPPAPVPTVAVAAAPPAAPAAVTRASIPPAPSSASIAPPAQAATRPSQAPPASPLARLWLVSVNGHQEGPMTGADIVERIRTGRLGPRGFVFTSGMKTWQPVSTVPEFAAAFAPAMPSPTQPPVPTPPRPEPVNELDYRVMGEQIQFVELVLDPGEGCYADANALVYADAGVDMQTVSNDASAQQGAQQGTNLIDKLLSAGRRLIAGEALTVTVFWNRDNQRRKIAFAASTPGSVVPLDLRQHSNSIVVQRDALLCAAKGIAITVALQRRINAGLFGGGDDLVMLRLAGAGLVFAHGGGVVLARRLAQGESVRVEPTCLVACETTVGFELQAVAAVRGPALTGDGLALAALSGPGMIWVQSLPPSRMARQLRRPLAPVGDGGGAG